MSELNFLFLDKCRDQYKCCILDVAINNSNYDVIITILNCLGVRWTFSRRIRLPSSYSLKAQKAFFSLAFLLLFYIDKCIFKKLYSGINVDLGYPTDMQENLEELLSLDKIKLDYSCKCSTNFHSSKKQIMVSFIYFKSETFLQYILCMRELHIHSN